MGSVITTIIVVIIIEMQLTGGGCRLPPVSDVCEPQESNI